MSVFDDIGANYVNGEWVQNPGRYSFENIKTASLASALIGADPLLRDTSDLRDFSGNFDYHFSGNAVDFGDDQQGGSNQQFAFANWIASNYGFESLEIIHLNADGSYVTWKNGQRVSYDFYGDETMKAHRNHVHWAITNTGLHAANPQKGFPNDMKTINMNGPVDGNDPTVRRMRYLIASSGIWYDVKDASHPAISNALVTYQKLAGLTPDGICGPVTWNRFEQPLLINGHAF